MRLCRSIRAGTGLQSFFVLPLTTTPTTQSVDTGEPFPLDMWCRLVLDRAGNKYKPSYALWRTLRTY